MTIPVTRIMNKSICPSAQDVSIKMNRYLSAPNPISETSVLCLLFRPALRKSGFYLLTFALLLLSGLHASALSINLTNASFESPNMTATSPFYQAFPTAFNFGTWIGNGAGTFQAVVATNHYGATPAGMDAKQFGDASGASGGGMFQDAAPYNNLGDPNLYWQAGQAYSMTVGVFLRSDSVPGTGRSMDVRLFYRTAQGAAANILSARTLTVGTSTLSTNAITDYTLTWMVLPGAPEVGKPIGIWFASGTTGSGGTGDWGFDNVRLSSVTTPASTWSGSVNGDWDIGTTTNWLVGATPVVYANGTAVTFNDTATGATTVNQTTNIIPVTLIVSNATKNYTFTGNGSISGVRLLKQGVGSLTVLSTNAFSSGNSEIQNGTAVFNGTSNSITGEFWVGSTTTSAAAMVVSNALMNASSWLAIGRGNGTSNFLSTVTLYNSQVAASYASMGFDGGVVGNLARQALTLNGNSTFTLTGNVGTSGFYVGESGGSDGSLYLNNTSRITSAARILVGRNTGSTGSIYVGDSATLTVNNYLSVGLGGTGSLVVKSNAALAVSIDFNVADLANSQGTVYIQDNAQVNLAAIFVGRSANALGSVYQSGGTVNGAGIQLGVLGLGNWYQSGGTFNITNGWVSIGNNGPAGTATSAGILTVAGGSFNQTTLGNGLMVGDVPGNSGTAGTLNIIDSGVVNVASTAAGLVVGNSLNCVGTVNLDGGLLTTTFVQTRNGGSGTFNFNGGTLRAGPGFKTNFMSSLTAAYVRSGGAFIDTGSNTIAITQALLDGSGNGGLTKLGIGTLALNGISTYSGATVISNGTLQVNGQLAAGGVTVKSGAIISGTGLVGGSVTIQTGGTLAPGVSVGTLTVNGNLTLAGNLLIELDKSLGASNDLVVVSGTLANTGTGTLTVSNLGPALVAGDSFKLFNKALVGGAALTITSMPGAGLAWSNNLAVDGTLAVISTISTVPPTLTYTVSGSNLTLSWPADHLGWRLLVQTNTLDVGLNTNWFTWPNSTNLTSVSISIKSANPSVFFRLVYP